MSIAVVDIIMTIAAADMNTTPTGIVNADIIMTMIIAAAGIITGMNMSIITTAASFG